MNPKIPNTREIRKVPCVACKGVGHSWEDGKKPCERCASKGWVEEVPGEETVCPQCHGDGVAPAKIKHECKECDGKGYAVRIIELVPHRIICNSCNCTGKQKSSSIHCPQCEGLGVIENRDDGLVNELGFCIVDEHLDEEIACPKCNGDGYYLPSVTCKICEGYGYKTRVEEVDVTPLPKENG